MVETSNHRSQNDKDCYLRIWRDGLREVQMKGQTKIYSREGRVDGVKMTFIVDGDKVDQAVATLGKADELIDKKLYDWLGMDVWRNGDG